MKKFISVLILCAGMLLAASCGDRYAETVKSLMSGGYRFTAEYVNGSLAAEILVTRLAPAQYLVKFLSPASLNGLTFLKSDGEMTVEYGNMKYVGGVQRWGDTLLSLVSSLDSAVSAVPSESDGKVSFGTFSVEHVNGVPVSISFGRILLKVTSFEAV